MGEYVNLYGHELEMAQMKADHAEIPESLCRKHNNFHEVSLGEFVGLVRLL